MKLWADPARDRLCDLIDSFFGAATGTASACFELLDFEPLTPCIDAKLEAIHAAVVEGQDLDEAVEQELGSSGVSTLCIMASELPNIVALRDYPDDGMTEECIADMLENRLRYWFKARCDRFDFWLAVYLGRAEIDPNLILSDGKSLGDVCRRLAMASPATRERIRRDLSLTKSRGGDVLRYFNFASKFLI